MVPMETIQSEANRLRAELARLNEAASVWLSGIIEGESLGWYCFTYFFPLFSFYTATSNSVR